MIHEHRIKLSACILIVSSLVIACNLGDLLSLASSQIPSSDSTDRYIVKNGDTFGKIAQDYGITIEQLIDLNKDRYKELARDPSLVRPGMELSVPNRGVSLATRSAQTAISAERASNLAQTATIIIQKINVERAGKKDLSLLRENSSLTSIASRRSTDMIERNYFAHTDPANGQEPFLRYLQADKYAYSFAGENIAEIKNDVEWVPSPMTVAQRYTPSELADQFVSGWLGSNEHRVNIFSTRFNRTGVALAVSSDGRRIVATQLFSD